MERKLIQRIVSQDPELAQPIENYHFIFATDDGHGIAKTGVFDFDVGFYAMLHFILSCETILNKKMISLFGDMSKKF